MSLDPENECPNCGEWKDESYKVCFPCSLDEREDVEMDECPICGNDKKAGFDSCYDCFQKSEAKRQKKVEVEGPSATTCECGEWKGEDYDKCYMCSKAIKDMVFERFKSNP